MSEIYSNVFDKLEEKDKFKQVKALKNFLQRNKSRHKYLCQEQDVIYEILFSRLILYL